MPEANLFIIFTNRLDEMDLRYMVTGAVASIFYGEPRLTHDIDLVVEIIEETMEEIKNDRRDTDEPYHCEP